jgi:cytohesin
MKRLLLAFSLLLPGSGWAADQSLLAAVRAGDRPAIQAALQGQPDVNQTGADGATPLMWAAHRDDMETVQALIRRKANLNAANQLGATALYLACENGSVSMVSELVQAGANPNLALLSGETPLMVCAARGALGAIQPLLNAGANIDAAENRGGQNALMWAVAENRVEVVRALLARGANVKARTKRGSTPLLFAAGQGNVEIGELLLKSGASPGEATAEDGTALVVAAASGRDAFAGFLLENGADANAADADGYTALHHAAAARSMLPAVKALLAHGANSNARLVDNPSRHDSNPMWIGATPFLLAASARNLEAMKMLAAAGADSRLSIQQTTFLNASNGHRLQMVAQTTPLMVAVGAGRYKQNYPQFTPAEEQSSIEAAQYILDLGGDINAANEYGQTALHAAAYLGADSIIRFLVGKGARIDARDNFGQTALSIAHRIHTVELGSNFDMQPRRVYETTSQLLLSLGAASLEATGVRVAIELEAQ